MKKKKLFRLAFNKEPDGAWYIEFPGYPFAHHNLMMVAGADLLCDYVADKQGHPHRAVVDATLDEGRLDGREPDVVMKRFEMGYGASYRNALPQGQPPVVKDRFGCEKAVGEAWLCPVTLLVLGRYPKKINLYIAPSDN